MKSLTGKLQGKVAVITGGTAGIGLATAKRFVAEGAFVYVMGRTEQTLGAALSALGASGAGIAGNVAKAADLDRLFANVRSEKGVVDVLFANAGSTNNAPLGKITEEQYEAVFDVNARGTLLTVQKALPLLRSGSSIILTGSTAGVQGTAALSI